MNDDSKPVPFDYTHTITAARQKLDSAELNALKRPDDPNARKRLQKALKYYKRVLENPQGK